MRDLVERLHKIAVYHIDTASKIQYLGPSVQYSTCSKQLQTSGATSNESELPITVEIVLVHLPVY